MLKSNIFVLLYWKKKSIYNITKPLLEFEFYTSVIYPLFKNEIHYENKFNTIFYSKLGNLVLNIW